MILAVFRLDIGTLQWHKMLFQPYCGLGSPVIHSQALGTARHKNQELKRVFITIIIRWRY